MSKNIRIIPRLDIKGPDLVKGIHLEGLRVLGKPEQFARHYYEQGADELIYMDVVASLYQRNSLHEIIKKTANAISIPLTVGGGLRTLADIRDALRAGADKVSINTAAISNPQFIREAARKFGSSTILVSIEAIKQPDGRFLAYTDNGREYTALDVLEWATRVEELGAGEIMVTSIDQEGTGKGYDIELTRSVAQAVTIPVIASGGAGRIEHIDQVINEAKADAVAVASLLHYDFIRSDRAATQNTHQGNSTFLNSGKLFSIFDPADLRRIKKYLLERGIECRMVQAHD